MQKFRFETIIWMIVIMALVLVVFYFSQKTPNIKEYNRHVCETYGYQSDCKTPLAK